MVLYHTINQVYYFIINVNIIILVFNLGNTDVIVVVLGNNQFWIKYWLLYYKYKDFEWMWPTYFTDKLVY